MKLDLVLSLNKKFSRKHHFVSAFACFTQSYSFKAYWWRILILQQV